MKKIAKILIDGGDTFEGSHEQFQDCFFSNEFDEGLIRDFFEKMDSKVEFIYEENK